MIDLNDLVEPELLDDLIADQEQRLNLLEQQEQEEKKNEKKKRRKI